MINNKYFSYKISNIDSSRNSDTLIDSIGISPLKSCEIKIAKIPFIKHITNKKMNINIKVKQYNGKNNLLINYHKLKSKKNLSALRIPKKRINILFFNDLQIQSKKNKERKVINNKKSNIKSNNKTLANKLKKFHSCNNLILGKYPTGHRLLLPIQRSFKSETIVEENFEKNILKAEKIYIIDDNIDEKKLLKEKLFKDKIKKKEKIKEKLISNNDIKEEKEEKENKKDLFKEKIEIIFKIKKNKRKENKNDRNTTSLNNNILDKITRIHEYDDKIKKMNSIKIKKRNSEHLKEEKEKENSTIDKSKKKDVTDTNIKNLYFNRNNKNNNSEFKSNSFTNIYEKNKDINKNLKQSIKPINIFNNKKVEIKVIDNNKENNINFQVKENQTEDENNKEDSQKLSSEKTKTKRNYFTKDELLERIVKTRKEYLEKEKNQSVQNITDLYYLIFPGNASYLIKNCMNHRLNWKEPFSNVTTLYNFKWTQLSYSLDYSTLGIFPNSKQLVNHFENHFTISNKANMFFNLMNYCENNKISVFKYVPFTIIYRIRDRSKYSEDIKEIKRKTNLENLKSFIENVDKYIKNYDELGEYFIKDKNKNKIDDKKEEKKNIKKYLEMERNEDFFKVEKLEENSSYYTDIFQNIDKYIKEKKDDKNDKEIKIKKIGMNTMIEIPLSHYTFRNIWVIKAINLNRGMCIKVVNNFYDIEKIIEKFRQGVNYNFTELDINEDDNIKKEEDTKEKKEEEDNTYYCDNIIIQKYIENPLLYKGRKFDMRIWVLLTHQMKVFIFKEGHLKTCSIEYDINSKDSFSHITNYSFQKNNNNFEKYEIGNEVPFYEFQKYIDEKYPEKNYKIKIDLMKNLKEIIALTMQSVKDKINNNKNHQFEIFGYDFMLDENFKPFLIEINTNPGLEESSPWIKIIVPRMLDDALRLTLDQIFETKYDFNQNYKNEEYIKNYKIVMHKLKNKENPNSITNYDEIIGKIENKNNESENKLNDENSKNGKKKKYISPFPVPGYKLDDNLWEFVCDLNEKENKSDNEYTGIKHLLNKKNERLKTEKSL